MTQTPDEQSSTPAPDPTPQPPELPDEVLQADPGLTGDVVHGSGNPREIRMHRNEQGQ